MNVFDEDTARAAQALQAAASVLADAEATRNALQDQLTTDEGIVTTQTGLITSWQRDIERQQGLAADAQTKINQKTFAVEQLKLREPQPATEWISNPAYLDWQQRVAELLAELNVALDVLRPLQDAQDEAQRLLDERKAIAAPEKFEPPTTPPTRPEITQEWQDWWDAIQDAERQLRDATRAAQPARDAVALARSNHDGLAATPPAQQIKVYTAAHVQWQQEVAQLDKDIATETTARDTALDEVGRLNSAISGANALRQGAQTRIDAVRPQLAAATRDVADKQPAVDAARAAAAHIARWVAALAGTAPDAVVIGEVVVELTRRLTAAEDDAAAAGDEAGRTEEAAWRLAQRFDEVDRRLTTTRAALKALEAAHTESEKADRKVDDFLRRHQLDLF